MRATPTQTQNVLKYGHLRGPVTLTPGAERFTVELPLHLNVLGPLRQGFKHLTFRMQG